MCIRDSFYMGANPRRQGNEDADSATRTASDSSDVDVFSIGLNPANLQIAAASPIPTSWRKICTKLRVTKGISADGNMQEDVGYETRFVSQDYV